MKVLSSSRKSSHSSLVHHWPMNGNENDVIGSRDMIKLESATYTIDRFGNKDSGKKIFYYNFNCNKN